MLAYHDFLRKYLLPIPSEPSVMSDPFLGEIRIFAGNFAPYGWAFCHGQILPIVQNTALFSILGNTYGGDGRTTFALPNLQGRIPLHFGQGPGLSSRSLGEQVGTESVSLTQNQMPSHIHAGSALNAANAGTNNQPENNLLGKIVRTNLYSTPDAALQNMAEGSLTLQASGSGQPHSNMQPYLTLNFIIALSGIYPPRS